MITYYGYPIRLLKDVEATFKSIRKEVKINSDLVRIIHDKDFKIVVEHLSSSGFKFMVDNPKLEKDRIVYGVNYAPQNTADIGAYSGRVTSFNGQITNVFKNWFTLLRTYQNVKIHPEDDILKSYQEWFYSSFQFINDDGDDMPLTFEKQRQLSQFLELMIGVYEKEDEVEEDLLNQLRGLNQLIPQLT